MQTVAAVILLVGGVILISGHSLPIYVDSASPEDLSQKLEDLPRDERFNEWYKQRSEIETAHKNQTDLGRALMALGLGICISSLFLRFLSSRSVRVASLSIWIYWSLLWAVKFPLSMWYYSVRQARFDYPIWGDSIGIGLFQDFFAWILGFVVFSVLLVIVMIRYSFASRIALKKPIGVWPWIRTVLLTLWIFLLLVCIFPALMDGDEGMVLSCTGAIPIILLSLSSQRAEQVVPPKSDRAGG